MFDQLAIAAAVSPTPSFVAPNHDQVVDWVTVSVSLVAGLLGGLLGALISSGTQKRLAKDAAKATASRAMWNFHRAIRDFAAEAEGHWVRDQSYFTKTTREHLEAARQDAYPYRGYLGPNHEHLVSRNSLGDYDPHGNPMDEVDDWFKWSTELEKRLKVVFSVEAETSRRRSG
ncbi:hypothetical protein [Microbacterium sp. NPDC087592]|uniref:hypothetical protein n=1 Tax=Microbacterium sp. NPDC087592 TaxID=3364193 RepID=UPI003810756F